MRVVVLVVALAFALLVVGGYVLGPR